MVLYTLAIGRSVAYREQYETIGFAVPRYIFDAHDDQSAHWGDDRVVCDGRDEIERHVRRIIDEVQASGTAWGWATSLTTVFVFEEDGGIILTAYARSAQEIRFNWTWHSR